MVSGCCGRCSVGQPFDDGQFPRQLALHFYHIIFIYMYARKRWFHFHYPFIIHSPLSIESSLDFSGCIDMKVQQLGLLDEQSIDKEHVNSTTVYKIQHHFQQSDFHDSFIRSCDTLKVLAVETKISIFLAEGMSRTNLLGRPTNTSVFDRYRFLSVVTFRPTASRQ